MENIIKANDGQIFVRKNDEFIMGTTIVLGKNDTIDNYVQRDCTEEEMKVYYKQKEVYNQEVYQKHINEIKERVKAREEEIKKAREERAKAREERAKASEEKQD